MSEGGEKRISRRGFLKAAGVLLGAAAAGGAIKTAERIGNEKYDLRKRETLERFLGQNPEVFPGYYPYLAGELTLISGAEIHEEPRGWREQPEKKVITTNINEETFLWRVPTSLAGQIKIKNPFIVLHEADSLSQNTIVLKNPKTEEEKSFDLEKSWIVFGISQMENPSDELKGKIERSLWKVGSLRLGDTGKWKLEGKMTLSPEDISLDQNSPDFGLR